MEGLRWQGEGGGHQLWEAPVPIWGWVKLELQQLFNPPHRLIPDSKMGNGDAQYSALQRQ